MKINQESCLLGGHLFEFGGSSNGLFPYWIQSSHEITHYFSLDMLLLEGGFSEKRRELSSSASFPAGMKSDPCGGRHRQNVLQLR
jgi:hypothetical protein